MLRKKLKLTPMDDPRPSEATSEEHSSEYSNIPEDLLGYEYQLSIRLNDLTFKDPVHYVYNPLEYAWDPHSNFVNTYCRSKKEILFLGLNPGPWGMCQTGVPFGEIKATTEWLKVTGKVSVPKIECPKKEVKGFECHRTEQSGKRFYGFFRELCSSPDAFFEHSFVYNLCPLAFMKKGSANITPHELKGQIKKDLEQICNETLVNVLKLLDVQIIVALGRYTEKQAKDLVTDRKLHHIRVVYMPHPSPRVVGNDNWFDKARDCLEQHDLLQYFVSNQ